MPRNAHVTKSKISPEATATAMIAARVSSSPTTGPMAEKPSSSTGPVDSARAAIRSAFSSMSMSRVRSSASLSPAICTTASAKPAARAAAVTFSCVVPAARRTCSSVPPVKSIPGFKPPVSSATRPGTSRMVDTRYHQPRRPTMLNIRPWSPRGWPARQTSAVGRPLAPARRAAGTIGSR